MNFVGGDNVNDDQVNREHDNIIFWYFYQCYIPQKQAEQMTE